MIVNQKKGAINQRDSNARYALIESNKFVHAMHGCLEMRKLTIKYVILIRESKIGALK